MKKKVVTEAMLRDMIHRAYMELPDDPDSKPFGQIEDLLYENGEFWRLIGASLKERKT